jgi:hypothetical protein
MTVKERQAVLSLRRRKKVQEMNEKRGVVAYGKQALLL